MRGPISVVCDRCGAAVRTAWHTMPEARAEAERAGWDVAKYHASGGYPTSLLDTDLCPGCRTGVKP